MSFPRSYEPWTEEEDNAFLKALYEFCEERSKYHQRSKSSVLSRIDKHKRDLWVIWKKEEANIGKE
jgi:hypothetical protein